jgi:CHAD domain-containing protein
MTVVEAAAIVVAEQARELRRQARIVRRRDDAEAVHQMRVATRRLRTALRALRGHIAPTRGLNKHLRWLGGELGAVRDCDVILALLRTQKLPGAARAERERLMRLIARLERRRGKRQATLRGGLKRRRYQRLLDELKGFADDRGGIHADHLLAVRVLTDVSETLGEAVGRSAAMTAPAPDADALHALRIMFKRLRYALDFHAVACGLAYDVERRMAREMQEVLGDIHDRDLLLDWLREGRGAFKGTWPRLEARLAAERARLMRRFLRLRGDWAERTRPEPTVAPIETPRFVNLEVQPVALRLVTGPKHVASSLV